jgi:hypothetical protein
LPGDSGRHRVGRTDSPGTGKTTAWDHASTDTWEDSHAQQIRPRSVYDVFAVLAFIVAIGTGSAYAANTVFSTDIVDGEVKSADIGANAVDSARVRDNTLNTFDVHSFLGVDVVDETLTGADVQDSTLTGADVQDGSLKASDVAIAGGLVATIGTVAAQSCVDRLVPSPDVVSGGHFLLTPQWTSANSQLDYSILHSAVTGGTPAHAIRVCNPTSGAINDGDTAFNELFFDTRPGP